MTDLIFPPGGTIPPGVSHNKEVFIMADCRGY